MEPISNINLKEPKNLKNMWILAPEPTTRKSGLTKHNSTIEPEPTRLSPTRSLASGSMLLICLLMAVAQTRKPRLRQQIVDLEGLSGPGRPGNPSKRWEGEAHHLFSRVTRPPGAAQIS
jgi:hypothetical protein